MANTISLADHKAQINGEPRYSKWFVIDQDRIDKFADVTEDWQFIHVDPEKAAKTPFGGTIAHGFLSLSLLSAMSYDCNPVLENLAAAVNYGFNKVRFTHPVKAGQKVRAKFTTLSVDEKSPTNIVTINGVEVEIEGESRPALTAEWVGYSMLSKGADA
ncbi:MAG: MaoC family dehydratase [Rhizobiaceae bacterium]